MRLSEWRKAAPTRDSMNNRVLAVLHPVLADLGADPDPECWVVWGDDPGFRYSVLVPTLPGVISVAIRLSGPEEGPRVTAKLIRWSKLSISELGVEASGGHRIVAVQVEGQVLKGMDEEADRICEFVRGLLAGIDGRSPQAMPIALVQAAPHRAGVAGPIVVSRETSASLGSKRRASSKAPSKSPAPTKPKASAGKSPRAVPRPGIGTAGPAAQRAAGLARSKPAGPHAAPLSVAGVAALPEPAVPAASVKPIAARSAGRRARPHPDDVTGADAPAAASERAADGKRLEPEPDRSEWIGPHPIEEAPEREPTRPRPWTP